MGGRARSTDYDLFERLGLSIGKAKLEKVQYRGFVIYLCCLEGDRDTGYYLRTRKN